MNLWLRLLIYLLGASFRPRIEAPFGISRLDMHVWPNDLDVNLHMNNGRYLTIMDIGRLDLIMRTGLARVARKRRWMPVLSAAKIRFRRELKPFQRFRLETRILWWARTQFVMEHRVVVKGANGGEHLAAIALMLGGLYERSGRRFVPVEELMQAMNVVAQSPAATPEVQAFLDAQEALKRMA